MEIKWNSSVHYFKKDITLKRDNINAYSGERLGSGYYILTTDVLDEEGNPKKYYFKEYDVAGNDTACLIYDIDRASEEIGFHSSENIVNYDFEAYEFETATLECFWGMENEGVLSIGIDNGLRKLHGIEVNKVTSKTGE